MSYIDYLQYEPKVPHDIYDLCSNVSRLGGADRLHAHSME